MTWLRSRPTVADGREDENAGGQQGDRSQGIQRRPTDGMFRSKKDACPQTISTYNLPWESLRNYLRAQFPESTFENYMVCNTRDVSSVRPQPTDLLVFR
jgi:hypothetical protein